MNCNTEKPYFVNHLEKIYQQKKKINPKFSFRSFSRHLKISQSTLSFVLTGKRCFPVKHLEKTLHILKISGIEKERFVKSVLNQQTKVKALHKDPLKMDSFQLSDQLHSKIIIEWEYYAILSLMDLKDFQPKSSWISKRLGISTQRTSECLKNLLESGLIEKRGTKLQKVSLNVKTSENVLSHSIRESHFQALHLAEKKLQSIPLHLRDYTTRTFVMNLQDMDKLKQAIKRFRNEISQLAESANAQEVYQLNLQLFPLTQVTNHDH